jgi:hypothetical protein
MQAEDIAELLSIEIKPTCFIKIAVFGPLTLKSTTPMEKI